MTQVAIYSRVSTDDKGQDPETQLRELRAWCQAAGHEIVRECVDHETGRNGKRKALGALMDDAGKRTVVETLTKQEAGVRIRFSGDGSARRRG